jgi:hypothetical protein
MKHPLQIVLYKIIAISTIAMRASHAIVVSTLNLEKRIGTRMVSSMVHDELERYFAVLAVSAQSESDASKTENSLLLGQLKSLF